MAGGREVVSLAVWGQGRGVPVRAKPPRPVLADTGRASCCDRCAAMTTVSGDPVRVESQLRARTLRCPSCGEGTLGPWGWARDRPVGRGDGRQRVRPRRSRCGGCGVTHVLLPVAMLLRRGDFVELIGRALELRAAGWGQRPIAAAGSALDTRSLEDLVESSESIGRRWTSRRAELCTAPVDCRRADVRTSQGQELR